MALSYDHTTMMSSKKVLEKPGQKEPQGLRRKVIRYTHTCLGVCLLPCQAAARAPAQPRPHNQFWRKRRQYSRGSAPCQHDTRRHVT